MDNPANFYSVGMFLGMGYLFSDTQERLRRAQRSTEVALAESNAAKEKITQLYLKTLELDELKNQFFANVSHELRTPLTLIMSPLTRRLEESRQSEAERREDEMMLRNARLLYRHVSDLLDAAKLEAGRMTIDYTRLDLGGLIRVVGSQFSSLATERGIEYAIEVPEFLEAEGDGEKIQRILLNLLSNAFKFTPDGGRVLLCLREEDGQAVIEVRDNGPGVPANMREIVFERFRQVEGSAQRRYGGTGLGLAIVKEFAELHGGSAGVDEASGGGASFVVRLPLAAPAGVVIQDTASHLDPVIDLQVVDELHASHCPPSPVIVQAGGDTPLVLIVEDNTDMNAYLANTLRPHYRVACAFDGREGLEQALALQPDLILSDVMMPVMSGDQMVLELRKQPGMDNVPIIILTAKADDELRVRLFKQGVQDYLSKPFSANELLARVGGLVASRLRSVEELQHSEAALKEAQRLAGIGNWEWDTRTDVHTWSEEIYRIYGRSPDLPPAVYPEVQHYFTPESWVYLSAEVEQALAHGVAYECDAEVVRPDGEHRWVVARGQAKRDADGKVVKLHGTVQDFTVRKQAELARSASEARFRRLFHEAPVPLAYVNKDGVLVDRNQRFDQIFGYSHDELSTLAKWWQLASPDPVYRAWVLDTWNLAVDHAAETGFDITPIEYRVTCKNGEVRIVLISGITIGDDFLATFFDVTERRQAEEQVRLLNVDLERRVIERTAELTAANQELDAFAYAVSHDLRAPLRAMSGFSQALIEDYGDKMEGEAKIYLDEIGLASSRMGELIDGILTLSRSTRNPLACEPVDLTSIAGRLLQGLAETEPERQVSWQVEPELMTKGDPRMVEVVMQNLLDNAWKYTSKTAAAEIKVSSEQRDGRSWICVADNGAGFDMAHAGKLFQPFQRLHRQEEFVGIGIGLATVQRIVHRHGGDIEAAGTPGKGARFCFFLGDQKTTRTEKS